MTAARLVLPALRWDPEQGFDHQAVDRALALGVGGFIVFGLNAIQGGRGVPARTLRALIIDATARAGRPLLWASDLERGAGQQVAGCSELPPPAALASLGDPALLRWAGWHTAREAHAVGLNWVMAPVCDLDLEPKNPIVQTRAFGGEAEGVGEAVAAWIAGARAGGVLTCAKHWPGHGRTTADSHDTLPVVEAPAQLLRDQDEAPFRAAIKAGVDSVMTAHVAYPALDPSGCAATFSAPILERLRAVGFEGLIATDALLMHGAGAEEPGKVALAAIAAGCDLLCYPTDLEATVAALVAAEQLTVEGPRIRESLERYAHAVREVHARIHSEVSDLYTADGVADALLAAGLRRGEVKGPIGMIEVEVVDDDLGGKWPASPNSHLTDALRAAKALERMDADTDASADAAPLNITHPHPHPHPAFRLLAAFAEPRASKGRAGFSAENRARLANLAPKADLVVLFGHPRLLKELPGDRPVLIAWHRQKLMQDAVARWLRARQ
ncbi:MAG: glycoside hydrolase family 3 N-terminal domain-containing protein [Gemmatimonadota bacterium]